MFHHYCCSYANLFSNTYSGSSSLVFKAACSSHLPLSSRNALARALARWICEISDLKSRPSSFILRLCSSCPAPDNSPAQRPQFSVFTVYLTDSQTHIQANRAVKGSPTSEVLTGVFGRSRSFLSDISAVPLKQSSFASWSCDIKVQSCRDVEHIYNVCVFSCHVATKLALLNVFYVFEKLLLSVILISSLVSARGFYVTCVMFLKRE